MQPFGNSLVTMTLTGAQMDAVLEQQFTGANGILQISHSLTYTRHAGRRPATAASATSGSTVCRSPRRRRTGSR